MDRRITLYTNNTEKSKATAELLTSKLKAHGFSQECVFTPGTELIVCIGGDGAFLSAVRKFGFPSAPFVGINTGHLGFFQEIFPDQIDSFIENYKAGKFRIQELATVKTDITHEDGTTELIGLNEIVIKGSGATSIHLDISIGGSFIQRFNGDGILVATPAGSTAYNYSVGGSIVDPRLKLLQVTPIAPMNTTAFRSFTSSILLPPDLSLGIVPEEGEDYEFIVSVDGTVNRFRQILKIDISFSDTIINLIRLDSYYFWNKVKNKFLDDNRR